MTQFSSLMVERHIITIWIVALSTGSFMSQNILNIGVWPWGPRIAPTRKSSHIVLSQIGLSPCSGEPCGSLPDPSKNQSFLHHHPFLFWLGNALHTLFPFTFPYLPVHGTPPYLLQLVSIVCLKDLSAGWPLTLCLSSAVRMRTGLHRRWCAFLFL